MTFCDAEALLFQSAERALSDVKSIHVATNEMEEILQLLTERDIEHTNNPPSPILRLPIFSVPSAHTPVHLRPCFSVCLRGSLRLYHPGCTSTKPSYIQTDPSIYSEAKTWTAVSLTTAERLILKD